MELLSKEILINDYNWDAVNGSDLIFEEFDSKIVLDRTNGYEVLHFCNKFLKRYDIASTPVNIRHIERCLHLKDLKNINSVLLLMRLISTNWYTYVALQFTAAGYDKPYIYQSENTTVVT